MVTRRVFAGALAAMAASASEVDQNYPIRRRKKVEPLFKSPDGNPNGLEAIQLDSSDPDPHGMTWHDGHLYYCDAGIAPGFVATQSKYAGYVCRVDL